MTLSGLMERVCAGLSGEYSEEQREENHKRIATILDSPEASVKEDISHARCEICGGYKQCGTWVQHEGGNYHVCTEDYRKLKIERVLGK